MVLLRLAVPYFLPSVAVVPVFVRAWNKTSHECSAAQASNKGASKAVVTRKKRGKQKRRKTSVIEIPASRVAEPLAASPSRNKQKRERCSKLGDARVDRGAPARQERSDVKSGRRPPLAECESTLAASRQPLKRAELRLEIASGN